MQGLLPILTQRVTVAALASVAAVGITAMAHAQIKQPGAHAQYSTELEPHLVVQWRESRFNDDALGVGLRATIPFLDNGPIPKINNNMGIGFGFDWTRGSDDCYWSEWADCTEDNFILPVVVQWNFFLTPSISVFAEPGVALHMWRAEFEYVNCNGPGDICDEDYSDTDLEPVMFMGGRFMVSDEVGFLLRLGTPYVSAGVSILM